MTVFVADEQTEYPVDLQRLRALAVFVLADRGVPDAMEVNVLCIDRAAIAELNAHHMSKQGPTDVLAFPIDMPGESQPGVPAILGDVVLCPDVAQEQATTVGKPIQNEVDLLCVHGLLHLLGHDHAEQDERTVMFTLTDRLLTDFATQVNATAGAAE